MSCSYCPAQCDHCNGSPQMTEVEHTIIARGNPDVTFTYNKRGYMCEKESFFFCEKSFLFEEEVIINRFLEEACRELGSR